MKLKSSTQEQAQQQKLKPWADTGWQWAATYRDQFDWNGIAAAAITHPDDSDAC